MRALRQLLALPMYRLAGDTVHGPFQANDDDLINKVHDEDKNAHDGRRCMLGETYQQSGDTIEKSTEAVKASHADGPMDSAQGAVKTKRVPYTPGRRITDEEFQELEKQLRVFWIEEFGTERPFEDALVDAGSNRLSDEEFLELQRRSLAFRGKSTASSKILSWPPVPLLSRKNGISFPGTFAEGSRSRTPLTLAEL